MFSLLLVTGLFSVIVCVPLPNPSTELLPNEQFAALEPSSNPVTNIPQEIISSTERDEGIPADEEKLEAQETFYPMGGVWWGVRPWGGWGGWGGYRPWYRPPWGGHWGGRWGGHWGGGTWGRAHS